MMTVYFEKPTVDPDKGFNNYTYKTSSQSQSEQH